MNKIDFKNPRNIYVVVVVLLILAGSYVAYDQYVVPFDDEKARLEAELVQLRSELDRINVQKKRLVVLDEQLKSAERDFEKLKEMFPEEEKVPLRLQDLYSVIRSSGVQITKFSPGTRTEKEYYVEHTYQVSINAGYHMLGYLFAEIANFSYPTAISGMKVGRYAGIQSELKKASLHGWIPITTTVNFNLTTYTSKKIMAKK